MSNARHALRGLGKVLLLLGALALLAGVGLTVAEAARGVSAYADSLKAETAREVVDRRMEGAPRPHTRSLAGPSLCFLAGVVAGVVGLALRLIPLRETDPMEELDELIAREREATADATTQRSNASSSDSAGPPADRAE